MPPLRFSNALVILTMALAVLPACSSMSGARLPEAAFYEQALTRVLANSAASGAALVIDAPGEVNDRRVAIGVAGDGRDMASDLPVRIASVTKTYVAAAVLRLVEQGRLDLDMPIAPMLSVDSVDSLRLAGYDASRITVRHLMTHTAGLPDHANETYLTAIVANPARHWTREDQVAMLRDIESPGTSPGTAFLYSDTGYVLLGELIERRTGQSLAGAVRALLRLNDLRLRDTWWEMAETPPDSAPPRARQSFSGMDVTDWSATVDLYGGGGLVASAEDMATFFRALFNGAVFDAPGTLNQMLSTDSQPPDSPYRLGVFEYEVDGVTIYEHGGFWGTNVMHAPSLNLTVSGVVLDQSGYPLLREVMRNAVSSYSSN